MNWRGEGLALQAKRVLKTREGTADPGRPILTRVDRITYDEAAADLTRHYEIAQDDHAVPRWAKAAMKPLAAFFARRRLVTIAPPLVAEHVQQRQTAGTANATINGSSRR